MERIEQATTDITRENIEQLIELFPSAATEVTDAEGNVHAGVDFDVLRDLLGDVAEGQRERYQFTWPGKREARALARKPCNKTMRLIHDRSVDWDTTENLYIEGDNLEALKIMRETYAGQVKLIYIDPPYNTGHDFVYDDDYALTHEEYAEVSGDYDETGGRLVANLESNGRFHSDWCSMLYPRLLLARDLLSSDGVIFVSIDDSELENLRRIGNEVFTSACYIATIVRNTNSSKNQSLFVSVSHEYCVIWAKNINVLKQKHANNKWGVPKNNVDEYVRRVEQLKKMGLSPEEITDELKELTKYPRFIDFTNYWYFDDRGLYRKGDLGGVPNGNKEPLMNPLTGEYDPVPPGGFRFPPERLRELAEDGRIHFHTDGSLPTIKRYLSDYLTQRPKSIMSDDQRPDVNMLAGYHTPFDNPKQLAFIKRMVGIIDDDAVVMDFFSGSATTAHAVMQLNAEDGGTRRFIMVQLPEECDAKSAARAAGYDTICEIGEERIRRAGAEIKAQFEQSQLSLDDAQRMPDIGFRVLRIDTTNYRNTNLQPNEQIQASLLDFVDNLKEDRTPEDLLFQTLPAFRIPYSAHIEVTVIDGVKCFDVNYGQLLACFEIEVPTSVIEKIAQHRPLYAVFRDASLKDDSDASNFEELFKTYSPETIRRVI